MIYLVIPFYFVIPGPSFVIPGSRAKRKPLRSPFRAVERSENLYVRHSGQWSEAERDPESSLKLTLFLIKRSL